MRLICAGSQTWDRADVVWGALGILAAEAARVGDTGLVVVHGACFPKRRDPVTGRLPLESADYLAYLWVRRGGHPLPVEHEPHPANWAKYRRGAGPIRNRAMAKLGADLLIAFLRAGSPGTTDMVQVAEEHEIPTKVIDYAGLPEREDSHV